MLFIRSDFFRTGTSCCQWTPKSIGKRIVWDFSNFWNCCYFYMETKKKKETPHQKNVFTQPVNIYISMNKNAKAYHCPKLWFILSRCNSIYQGYLLLSTQTITDLVLICLFLPHLWDPANLRVLWSLTRDQKATKLTQQMEQVSYLKFAFLTCNTT